jgi:hypothetical protein
MNNMQLIGLGLIAIMAFGGLQQQQEVYYRLPNGMRVPESQLPNYGYVNYMGQWIHINSLNQYFGENGSGWDWQSAFQNGLDLIQEGFDLWGNIQNIFQDNSD